MPSPDHPRRPLAEVRRGWDEPLPSNHPASNRPITRVDTEAGRDPYFNQETVSRMLDTIHLLNGVTPRRSRGLPVVGRGAVPASRAARWDELRVLLVEDDENVRDVISDVLSRRQVNVRTAANGGAALHELVRCHAETDLLISDVVMPGIDGCELARRVHHRWPEIAILLISGHVGDVDVEGTLPRADAGFLSKPFVAHQLLAAIRRALAHDPSGNSI